MADSGSSMVFNMFGGGGGGVKLTGIAITTEPDKTEYKVGESFDAAGMVVTATYSNGATLEATGWSYSPSGALSESDTEITIRYTEGGVSKTATQAISVSKTQLAVPTQSGSLAYTGSSQTPSWNGYDESLMSIGGKTSATTADSYEATFTLLDTTAYEWDDGTTESKSASWTIGKATGSMSLSKTEVTLNTSTLSDTVTVTRSGDGKITVTSSDESIATASVSGNVVTIANVNQASGSAKITIKVAAGTNYTSPGSLEVSVTATFVSSTLNDNDWETIKSISDASTGADYWAEGDGKTITISGTVGSYTFDNLSIQAFILGFDHNSSVEGTGRIHFMIGKIDGVDVGLCDSSYSSYPTSGTKAFNWNHYWDTNYYGSNFGGWKGCDMRYDILGSTNVAPSQYGQIKTTSNVGYDANGNPATSPVSGSLMAALPSDLRAVMKSVSKYTDNVGNASNTAANVTATVEYLWLASEFEIFGSRSYANQYEQNYQKQYSYFAAGNSKIAYQHTAVTTAVWQALRSPYCPTIYHFCAVNTSGGTNPDTARYCDALRPCFAA